MKANMKTVEYDMKQLFGAFIDCYKALDFIADKEGSDDERDLEMAERVNANGAAIAATAIKSAIKNATPGEGVFVLSVAMADIAANVSHAMFEAEAMIAMEEDE